MLDKDEPNRSDSRIQSYVFVNEEQGFRMGFDISQIRILLAEANGEQQHILLLALARRQTQMNVTVVASGAAFLRAIAQKQFDCVIVEDHLPDGQVDQLLEKASAKLTVCAVVIVTSDTSRPWIHGDVCRPPIAFVSKSEVTHGDRIWREVEQAIEGSYRQRGLNRRRRHYRALPSEVEHLTGLRNRRFLERCRREQRWSQGDGNLACLMLGIDRIQLIRNQYGQSVVEDMLRLVAATTREHLPGGAEGIHWTQDILLIVKPAAALVDEWLWAERLRQQIERQSITVAGAKLSVTASIGLARCSTSSFGDQAVRQAEAAMLLAQGKAGNVVCTTQMVTVAQTLRGVAEEAGLSPEQRRTKLMHLLVDTLGPTQWEHINDHCEKVSRMAVRIAQMLNLQPKEIERIRIAGLMHDIGKCVIPEELLAKPRTLSAQEWDLISQHDMYGAWITDNIGVDEQTTRFIQNHHRRFDASPDDEKVDDYGQNKPDGGRILCVADALVTMLTTRSYRVAMQVEQAMTELRRECGKQFDPHVVDALHRSNTFPSLVAA